MGLMRMLEETSAEVIRQIELLQGMFCEQPFSKPEIMLVLSLQVMTSESERFWETIHKIASSKAID